MLTVTGLVSGAYNLGSEWVIRVVVVVSLVAHVFLAIFAGIRRRQAYCVLTPFLWLAYQYIDWVAPFVLSNLSIGSTLLEIQLVTLWLPCMVAYRAGPDNITAYSLEDIKTSMRLWVSAIFQIGTIVYVVVKQARIVTSRGPLFWASVVMVLVGIFKYFERVLALSEGNFGNMRNSLKKKDERLLAQPFRPGKLLLGNVEALLTAHEVLHITKGAFADFAVSTCKLKKNPSLKVIFSVEFGNTGWENMCRVVEMELSLMYDILYTKSAVIHNWRGYAIRIVSLVVTASVMVLFSLYNKDGQRTADVCITYTLLAMALLLDVRWLLGAAASSWTYAFFNASRSRWLHHQVCCTGRWHQLRRFVVSLDPWQLPLREHGGGYRLWSGTMGQYNLLDEVIHGTTSRFSCLIKTFGLEETWMEHKYSSRLELGSSEHVKQLLFEQIQKAFKMQPLAPPPRLPPPKEPRARPPPKKEPAEPPIQAQILEIHRDLDEELGFLPEFQELILIWHVATDVFLMCGYKQRRDDQAKKYMKAISAVSDYMAFLAAVRPDMLPGLKLRIQHEATRQALDSLWNSRSSSTSSPHSATGDKEQLVKILRDMEPKVVVGKSKRSKKSALYNFSIILSDGIIFADLLEILRRSDDWKRVLDDVLHEGSNSWKRFMFLIPEIEKGRPESFGMLDLLKLVLKSWVRMLIYVSIRCSRDSHAKQLGRGCELTTIVWILSEHAGIFAPEPRDGR